MNTVFLSFYLKLNIYIYIPLLFNKKSNYLKILNIQINIFDINYDLLLFLFNSSVTTCV
jgi:hypothetical protein